MMAEETKSDATMQAPPPAEGVQASEQPRNPNMKWYIIHAYSGFERKVKESLESPFRRLDCKRRLAAC